MAQDRLVRDLLSASISCVALSLFLISLGWNAGIAADRLSASPAPVKQASHAQHIRLASFAPSCTELLQAIKADKELIGACKYCDLPDLNPANIVGDFNSANLERLTRLNPDMVLTVSGQDALTNSLKKNRFTVTTFPNSQLTDIGNNLRLLGKLTKHEKLALQQAEAFERSIKDLQSICCSTTSKKPTVFFCVWPQPLMTAGQLSFLDQAITVCGGTNIAHNLITAYPQFSLERLLIANPDVVIMPFESNVTDYLKRAPWTELKASRQNKVYFVPKYENNRLSRPSTFVIDGLYWLGITLHPEKAKELAGWIKKSQSEQGRTKQNE
jgi:iron complex transport system substrate-binding protein